MNLLVLAQNFLGIRHGLQAEDAFGAIGTEAECHLLELGWLVRDDSVDVAQLGGGEPGWVGIFDDGDAQQAADRHTRDPQHGDANQGHCREDAPMRPLLVLRPAQLGHPGGVIRPVGYEVHERREEDRQHRERTHVLPA